VFWQIIGGINRILRKKGEYNLLNTLYVEVTSLRKDKKHSVLFFETIRALSLMMDLDENEKLYHSWRVGIMSAKIADIIAPDEKREIFYAGLLHDIGGIALPDHIIHYHKIEEHFKNPIIFNHPEKGSSIVEQIPGLVKSAAMIKQHHEMWNGEPIRRFSIKKCLVVPHASALCPWSLGSLE